MKRKGFTLVELIVSIVLVGIVLASMIGTLLSLKNTYNVVNEDMEARTYSTLVSKIINEHIMKNNGIKDYDCAGNKCVMTLGTLDKNGNNKKMTLEIVTATLKSNVMKDNKNNSNVGSLMEKTTTIKYYGEDYSYYKTLKYYDRHYTEGNKDIITGYKFENIKGTAYLYDKPDTELKDYLVNITIEMNNPKYNIEVYSTSEVKDADIGNLRLYRLTYNSNGGSTCPDNPKVALDRQKWGELCLPTKPYNGFKGWFIQKDGIFTKEITAESVALEDIDVYAHWDPNKYSCEAGKYLPAGKTSCEICREDNYCPGITDVYFDKFNDQGIEKCLTGYHSPAGGKNASACKITCTENHHVKKANDSSCTSCLQGYASGRHEVAQGNVSSCSIVDPEKPTITGGTEVIYGSNNITLTCTTPSLYESSTNIYYSFGYAGSQTGTLGSWSTAQTSNTLTIDKSSYIGNRYYACRIYASGSGTSNTINSEGRTQAKIRNAKITFDKNGGNLSGTSPRYTKTGDTTLYDGELSSTTASAPTANKTGHDFNGWFTASSGGSKILSNANALQSTTVSGYIKSSKWVTTTDKTLYAQFSPHQYKVTFDCNGGSGAPTEQTATYGSKFTLTSSVCSTPKSGYTQDGWNTKSDGKGTNWTTGNTTDWTWNITDDIKLYAKWVDKTKPICSISRSDYNAFSWTASDAAGVTGYAITNSSTAPTSWTTTGTLTSGTKDVSTANTWYLWAKDAAGNVCNSANITSYTVSRSQGTGSTLTTRYDSTSASTGTAFTSNTVMLSGTSVWAKSEANTGYKTPTLKHGSTTMTASGASYTVSATETITSGATINTYTLTANAGSGTIPATAGWTIASGSKTATKSVNYNDAYGTLPAPTWTGYTFKGWFTAASGGTQVTTTTKMAASNTTIYAHWDVDSYKLTYDSEGGSTCSPASITKTKDSAWGTLCSPTKTGYKFVEWNTNANGTGTKITSSSTATSNITVHAIWAAKVYTLVRRTENYMKTKEDVSNFSTYGSSTITAITGGYRIDKNGVSYGGAQLPSGIFVNGRRYIITYTLKKYSGTLNKIGGHMGSSTQNAFKINGVNSTLTYDNKSGSATNININDSEYKVFLDITFKTGDRPYIQPNRGSSVDVKVDITYLDIYEVLSTNDKEYNTNYGNTELNPEVYGDRGIANWYNNNNLTTKLTDSTKFNSETATFEDINTENTKAYIYGDVVNKPNMPVYCILTADKNGVYFSDKKGSKWVINESSSAPESSAYGTSTTKYAFGTIPDAGKKFYGHIIDTSGNTSRCSITIKKQELIGKYCTAEADGVELYVSYSAKVCRNGVWTSVGTYTNQPDCAPACSGTTCEANPYVEYDCRAGDCSGYAELWCPGLSSPQKRTVSASGGYSDTCTYSVSITATSCPLSGWHGPYNNMGCPNGTPISSTNYCKQ